MTREETELTRWFLSQILPHEAALRGWLGRKRGAGFEVDDVIQETYTVLSSLKQYRDIQFPKAYLFRVAQSVVARHIRQSRVIPIHAAQDLEVQDFPDDTATPEEATISRDELLHLAEAIAAMPGRTREAFTLRRVHGHSQQDIARRMGLSESTVEKHIARGIRLLVQWAADGGKTPQLTSNRGEGRKKERHGSSRNKSVH